MISALDHIAIVVPDLDAATARYSALLGCAPNWRGLDSGAENVWFQLDNMAFDIIAPVGPGAGGDRFRAHLDAHGEGIWAIAYATPDLDAAHTLMARRGITVTPPHPLRSTHVETKEKRHWRMFSTAIAGVTTFVMEQKAEDPPWPRCAMTAPSGITGLDHVVVRTPSPDRALAHYGARLGLDMRLDRTMEALDTRFLFFRCGDLVVEIVHGLKAGLSEGDDTLMGLTWRVGDIEAAHGRITGAGFNVSDLRVGRKPGTRVFTVRDGASGVATLLIGS